MDLLSASSISKSDVAQHPSQDGGRKLLIIAIIIGIIFRALLLQLGIIFDDLHQQSNGTIPAYTDIDYRVYSDAAEAMYSGQSPYERSTYRYPPLLAATLIPIHAFSFPEFGKLVFVFADIAVIYFIYRIIINSLKQYYNSSVSSCQSVHRVAALAALAWALNPISSNICTRGSSDSISNAFLLCFLDNLLNHNILSSGLIIGFLTYWRIYPIIYIPVSLGFLCIWDSAPQQRNNWSLVSIISKATLLIKFGFTAGIVLGIFTGISYYYFGDDYLRESVFYHVTRLDHRHNFSPYFFVYYLEASEATTHPVIMDTSLNIAATRLQKVAPMIPQIMLNLGITWSLITKSLSLPSACLLLTMIFVTYNKVITAQYFTWYLCLIPLVAAEAALMKPETIIFRPAKLIQLTMVRLLLVGMFWLLTLIGWLYWAYQLEFQSTNAFAYIWIASLLFHFANVFCILELFHCLSINRI